MVRLAIVNRTRRLHYYFVVTNLVRFFLQLLNVRRYFHVIVYLLDRNCRRRSKDPNNDLLP